MDADEAVGAFPELPRSLISAREGEEYRAAEEIPDLE